MGIGALKPERAGNLFNVLITMFGARKIKGFAAGRFERVEHRNMKACEFLVHILCELYHL